MNKKNILIISAVLVILVTVVVMIFALKGCNDTQTDVNTPITSQEDDGNWTSIYEATPVEWNISGSYFAFGDSWIWKG